MTQLRLGLIGLGAMCSRIATRLLRSGFSLQICDIADVALCTFNMDVDMVDAPALGTTEDAKAGKLTFFLGGADTAIERSRPIFETLGERILRAGAARSGQAAIALADFLRGLALTAATEALRTGEHSGLDAGMLLDIGEGLSAIGPVIGGMLRQEVLTRQFGSRLALGHLLKGLETASGPERERDVQAPLLAACRDAWAAAGTRLGSGADQTALIRWLETLVPPAAGSET